MNLELVYRELEECIASLKEYRNEFVSEELLTELNEEYMDKIRIYYAENNLEDVASDEINAYMESMLVKLKPLIEKHSREYAQNIDGRFFEFFAQFVVLDIKQRLFESIIDDLPIETQESPFVTELKIKYHERYNQVLEESGISKDISDKLYEEFRSYLVKEMHSAQIDILSKDINTEENRNFLTSIIKVFKEESRIKYKETITEELLEVITESAFVDLEVLHAKANPAGIEFAFPKEATRDEVEIMIRQAKEEHPHLFEGKNIEDIIDNAMLDIANG